MTPEQRATYFINMRLLFGDAKEIMHQLKRKGVKTSSLEKLEQFWNFFIQESEAAPAQLEFAPYISGDRGRA